MAERLQWHLHFLVSSPKLDANEAIQLKGLMEMKLESASK